jgi:hypothetical protein
MSDRSFSRKRPPWLIWVPSIVLVVLIAAAGVLAYQVSTGSVGREDPPSVAEAVTPDGYSRFSSGGIAYVKDTLQARVDLSEAAPSAQELGLPAEGETVVQGNGFSVSVGLYMGEDSIRIPSGAMTLTTVDGRLAGLTLDVATDDYQDQSALLERVIERFGMDDSALADLDAQVAEDVRTGNGADYTFGPGTDFGRPASATVTVFDEGATSLTVDIDFTS